MSGLMTKRLWDQNLVEAGKSEIIFSCFLVGHFGTYEINSENSQCCCKFSLNLLHQHRRVVTSLKSLFTPFPIFFLVYDHILYLVQLRNVDVKKSFFFLHPLSSLSMTPPPPRGHMQYLNIAATSSYVGNLYDE